MLKLITRSVGVRSFIRPSALLANEVNSRALLFSNSNNLNINNLKLLNFKKSHNLTSKRTVITSNVDWKPVKVSEKVEWTTSKYIFLGLLILMPVISFMLGTWQLRRLKWKNNLIATCEDRLTYDPIPLPKNITPEDAEDWQYRRVIIKGKFDHSREVFVGPKVVNERKGYTLFTPIVRSDGGPDILVERGFITDENVIPTRRSLHHLSVPQHEVEVECLIKKINPKAALTMDKLDPDSRLWHVLDYDEMTEQTHCMRLHAAALIDLKDHPIETKIIKDSKPWWKFWSKAPTHTITTLKKIENEQPGDVEEFSQYQFMKAGVPLGRTPSLDLRNNHLQYLGTWYGLCFASTILLYIVLRKKAKDPLKDKLKHARKYV